MEYVQCTMYTVHSTLYNVQCTRISELEYVQYTLYTLHIPTHLFVHDYHTIDSGVPLQYLWSYCNALFIGQPKSITNKLDKINNRYLRIMYTLRRNYNASITFLRRKFNWFYKYDDINLKILTLLYKTLTNNLLANLCERKHINPSNKTLRSSIAHRLLNPNYKIVHSVRALLVGQFKTLE